jgi:hypothetical protein
MSVASDNGVLISGIIFDAGPTNSPVLLQVGCEWRHCDGHDHHGSDPSGLYDVFFRIGGADPGSATISLVVNSDNVILDDIWAWRADHGAGVGWTSNTADTGLVVNGDNVTAYGLFVEHYHKYEVIWNGNRGTDIFLQNEMPYDPPSQPGGMDGVSECRRLGGLQGRRQSEQLRWIWHGQLQLLQPGREHLRRKRL